ncbi:type I-D CRISPR-associated endonuclease Cas1 [Cyanobacterium stanieri LEGE 03274]|uniref:CRISPR-associated endonuclease Cas1 n=1 Tax=Cyanobacterium stanieri LEGE 03274 TaxID=1828756 RepID=A0ABR9V6D8_9CHRO|nr:type I-D CRISPR-associated endonuclease Cas1d [Cyanobacterium stanieri]MBE9222409.1 type I-D CRISPR-associated endonuclease Cas1 [Cyanobacterium stanieri LEGE 03274]
MGTIYVTQDDAFIGKIDERIHIKADKQKLLEVPLIKVDGLVILGRANFSPALVAELLKRKIPMSFLTTTGKYLGRLEPELSKNIFVRKAQWSVEENTEKSIHIVKAFIRGKLKNYRNFIKLRHRQIPNNRLQNSSDKIQQIIDSLDYKNNINSLRGLEGAGSAIYFGCFDQLIKNKQFSFSTRNRRPPTDPVNSLLSLGYALLRHDLQSAINIVGFDPYLGYLHVSHYGRPSLALDLMEEFRPLVTDAVVLNLINNQKLNPKDFITEPLSNALSLTKEGLKIFLRSYEEKKQSKFKHPVLKRQCTYQEAFEIQTRFLAKYLMEETEQYPPLIIKK